MRGKRKASQPQWKSRYVVDRELAIEQARQDQKEQMLADPHFWLKEESDIVTQTSTSSNKCIFPHNNPWRGRWDGIVMILACINCFMVPLEVAVTIQELQESASYKVINVLVDVIFIIDLLVNFNTTFEQGYDVITSRKRISRQYLKTRFTIDFLSALPIDFMAAVFFDVESTELKMFSLLKLIRMLRLSRVIRALNVRRDIKSKIKLLKVFFQLTLYLHCQACVIWGVIQHEKLWQNALLSKEISWDVRFYSDAMYAQYMVSFYLSTQTLQGNDVLPYGTMQSGTHAILLMVGLVLQGQILGTFAEIIYEMNEINAKQQSSADSTVTAMTQVHLDTETKNISINYVKTVSMEKYYQQNFKHFQRQCSPNLINKINNELLTVFMESPKIFDRGVFKLTTNFTSQEMQMEIFNLSKLLVLEDRSVQSAIVKQGMICNGLYWLQKGTIRGYTEDSNGNVAHIPEQKKASLIGEISFFLKTKRTATIICNTSVRIFFLDIRYKKTLLELCPKIYKRMRRQIFRYSDDNLEYKVQLLRQSVFYFKEAEREALVEIAFQMAIKSYIKGSAIIQHHAKIRDLIIILDGNVLAMLPTQNAGVLFEQFANGTSFGLYSLLLYDETDKGYSRFRLTPHRYSWLIHIPLGLLRSVQSKYKELDKQIISCTNYVQRMGIPYCDFQINNVAIDQQHQLAKKRKAEAKAQEELMKDLEFAKQITMNKSGGKERTLLRMHGDLNGGEEIDEKIVRSQESLVGANNNNNSMQQQQSFDLSFEYNDQGEMVKKENMKQLSQQNSSFGGNPGEDSRDGNSLFSEEKKDDKDESFLVKKMGVLKDSMLDGGGGSSSSSSSANSNYDQSDDIEESIIDDYYQLFADAKQRKARLKKYSKKLVRAVGRQIRINAHRRVLLKEYKASSVLMLGKHAKDFELNLIDREGRIELKEMNKRINGWLDNQVFDRLQDSGLLECYEDISILLSTNEEKVQSLAAEISVPAETMLAKRQAIYGRLETMLSNSVTKGSQRLEFVRRARQMKERTKSQKFATYD